MNEVDVVETGEKDEISRWAMRFGRMSLLHGIFFLFWTAFIVLPSAFSEWGVSILEPGPTKIIAGGSAGMWFVMGYLFYFLIGVLAVGFFVLGYYLLENKANIKIEGIWTKLAWMHFILMNIGVILSTWMLMYAGYISGAMLNNGDAIPDIHHFLAQYTLPIGLSVLVLVIGVLLGITILAVHAKRYTGSWFK